MACSALADKGEYPAAAAGAGTNRLASPMVQPPAGRSSLNQCARVFKERYLGEQGGTLCEDERIRADRSAYAMTDFGLYYPNVYVQDEAWLKASALYWPRLGRMVPRAYPARESSTAEALRNELGFFVDIDPSRYADRVASEFLDFVVEHTAELQGLYELPVDVQHRHLGAEREKHLSWIHDEKVIGPLVWTMHEAGLAVERYDRQSQWVGMNHKLAWVYMSALAQCVAEANDMAAVTDQIGVHGVLNGWTVDRLARVLLDVGSDYSPGPADVRDRDEVMRLYAAIAVETVVPRGLADIPVGRIVRARRVLADEFDAFRAHLESLGEQFAELAKVESAEVLRARLQLQVERDLRRPTAELERGLRHLGLEPTRAVLGMKSLELPATAAAAATGAGVPLAVGQAGLIAAQFVASSMQAHEAARQQRRGAAGYLLGLREELDPKGVVDRVRRTLRREPPSPWREPPSLRSDRTRRWWRRS